LSRPDLQADLRALLEVAEQEQILSLSVLFGFAWGIEYRDYEYFDIGPSEILAEVSEAERREVGMLGNDDLVIRDRGEQWEVLYCHEADIHLDYNATCRVVEACLSRWSTMGWVEREAK
jgi:hypothetical protein